MDIHKEWEQLNQNLFVNQSLKNEEIMNATTSESSSAIYKIQKGLIAKSYWCLFFFAGFTLLRFNSRDNTESLIAIGIVNFMYLVGFIIIRRLAKKMSAELKVETDILSSMKRNLKLLNKSISIEKNIFLLGTPVIMLCASFYSRFENGETFDGLIQDSNFLVILIVSCIIALPFVYFVGNYLNKKSFGPYMNQLSQNISKLEGVEFLKTV